MTDRLLGLLIEFDEMGFAPTTVCPNPEQYATKWRERVRKEFARLTGENDNLTVELEVAQRDVENITRTLQEANEEIKALETENAELRARLDKAVDLEAKIGDILYMPWVHDGNAAVATLLIIDIHFRNSGFVYITNLVSDSAVYLAKYKYGIFRSEDFDNIIFTDRTKAEQRLAVLKGVGNEYL